MRFMVMRGKDFLIAVSLLLLSLGLLIVATPQASVLAASSDEAMAKLVEGAKKEGALVWYTTTEMRDADALVKSFTRKYPFIKPELVRLGGERLVSRVEAEARAGKAKADVIEHAGFWGEVMKRKGLFARYIHRHWQYFGEGFKDPQGYWTSYASNRIVMAYNTKKITPAEVPKTYEDLLAPKWKGRMGLVSNSESWFSFLLRALGEEKGLEYFRKLSGQNLRLRAGASLNTTLVAAGELEIGLRLYSYRVQLLKEQGAPIEWVALEPIVVEVHPIGVASNASHPNAARLFVDHILSQEVQEMVAKEFLRIPDRRGVETKVPELMCKGKKLVPYDPGIVDDYGRYVDLYKKIIMKQM